MYEVSTAWVEANNGFLAPEGFVELSCYIPELQQTLVYTKSDLLSFVHQQTASLVSGELPKNHIEFSLDNSDGRWNPGNPKGMERYLSERLRITVRYGMDINGTVEWIPGGVFYLSEWSAPPNGLEASFVARDILEYMIDQPHTREISGTLDDIVTRAFFQDPLPSDATLDVGYGDLKEYTADIPDYDGNESRAQVLQKCANAANCVLYQNREGRLCFSRLHHGGYDDYDERNTGYVIPKSLAYSYPEIELSKPLKEVAVTYKDNATVKLPFGSTGETQTLTNNYISTETQAAQIAKWVADSLSSRRHISGEFRGDPRLDLFDMVSVETKYGTIAGVILTDIKVTFTGAFRVSYKGYLCGSSATTEIYCGEVYAGEVV